jgi:hypothetical protein
MSIFFIVLFELTVRLPINQAFGQMQIIILLNHEKVLGRSGNNPTAMCKNPGSQSPGFRG